jgi:aspartyl-tRNA(Asn)/glutamyl-tRNA(Gln) amidotransferase subunit C
MGGTVLLTREEVEHIADLAKLGLTAVEIDTFREQLSAILDHAALLKRLDTDAIPPTASVLPLQNVMRADEVQPSLSQEDALANAPSASAGFFQVKAILQ